MTFLAKLSAAQRAHDSILCVGLDPEPASIPESLGRGPQAAVRFLRRIVRATAPHVCAYKPNLAFYERYGSAAMDVLALTLQAIPAEIPVILDAKRGDVPNTSAAYADALFDSFHADAATVAPYVGLDSIEPFTTGARFALVLARTSNPGAGDFQDLEVAGRPLYERVVERCVERFGADRCGFVVGATYPDEARRLRALAPDRLFLMPGIGSQGGEIGLALRAGLDANGAGVLPSASRSVLYASRGDDFEKAAGEAARTFREAANAAPKSRLSGVRSLPQRRVVQRLALAIHRAHIDDAFKAEHRGDRRRGDPCWPAPVSAMMRVLPMRLASRIWPMQLLILCAPVWSRSSRLR